MFFKAFICHMTEIKHQNQSDVGCHGALTYISINISFYKVLDCPVIK